MTTLLKTTALAAAVAFGASYGPSAAQAFTGLYLGVDVGYEDFDLSADPTGVDPSDPTVNDIGLDVGVDGLVYGGHVGYRLGLLGLVAGVEAFVADSASDGSAGFFGDQIIPEKGLTYGAEVQAGYSILGAAMIFGLVGYSATELDTVVQSIDMADQVGEDTFDGLRVGGGLAIALPLGFSARVKGTYQFTGSEEDVGFESDFDGFQVTAGLSYSF